MLGEGLLETSRHGSPLHSATHTCGAMAQWQGPSVSAAAALFADAVERRGRPQVAPGPGGGWQQRPPVGLVPTPMLQLNVQATRRLSIGALATAERLRGHGRQGAGLNLLFGATQSSAAACRHTSLATTYRYIMQFCRRRARQSSCCTMPACKHARPCLSGHATEPELPCRGHQSCSRHRRLQHSGAASGPWACHHCCAAQQRRPHGRVRPRWKRHSVVWLRVRQAPQPAALRRRVPGIAAVAGRPHMATGGHAHARCAALCSCSR